MTVTSPSIVARMEWCRWQSTHAQTDPEIEGWRAEEDGLRDALLHRDHTKLYRYGPPGVFVRYAMGFEDGHALMRLAWVARHVATSRQ